MTRTIAQRELRNDNAKIIEAVTAGETFVVTRNGEPVAELRPIHAGRRTFVPRADVVALAESGVRIDRHQFRADLDQAIVQDVQGDLLIAAATSADGLDLYPRDRDDLVGLRSPVTVIAI